MTPGNKGHQNEHDTCEACDALGDYMCSGMPDNRPEQAQNKMKNEKQQS